MIVEFFIDRGNSDLVKTIVVSKNIAIYIIG